jgi:hypothetical protein
MKQRKYLELSPEEATEHHLLRRRLEWLELKNTIGYRMFADRRNQIEQTYRDISDAKTFHDQLASIQDDSAANTEDDIA